MTIREFTDIFLPNLASQYAEGDMPLHALVDMELWRRLFPDQGQGDDYSQELAADQFHWYQVSLTCHQLKDGTLLLTYTLPQPLLKGEPKFVGIRLKMGRDQERRAVLYSLRKPASIYDAWDIQYVPFPNRQHRIEQKFHCKIEGTDSLRNFVFTVQHQDYLDNQYDSTLLDKIKGLFGGALAPQ